MSKVLSFRTLAVGMALFSMFFGAGNVAFPVYVGHMTQDMAFFAMLGLGITAIIVPFLGLLAVSAFDGDYLQFFSRLGRIPSWILVIALMLLVGPLGAIPRCIAISYSTLLTLVPGANSFVFSLLSCLVIFALTIKPNNVLDVLGKFLTPFLLLSLLLIIYEGIKVPADLDVSHLLAQEAFLSGLRQGYNTMDLLASFIFSGVVLQGIKAIHQKEGASQKVIRWTNILAGIIAMFFLAVVYGGMCYVGAHHGQSLSETSADRLLSQISVKLLGPYAGVVVCSAVSLACLTTAVSLCLAFAQFLTDKVSQGRLSYSYSLVLTLLVSFVCSLLKFDGLQRLIVPALEISLPALILFTIIMLVQIVSGRTLPVRLPVFATFIASLVAFCL